MEGSTPTQQIANFVRGYKAVLGSYYEAVIIRLKSTRLSAKVTSRAQALLQRPTNASAWRRFQTWLHLRDQIDEAFSALLDEKMHRATVQGFISNLQEDEEVEQDNVFYRFIKRETELREYLPDEDIRELLIMLEERRRGYFQNTATLFSGLAGGILGAVIGASATFMLNRHSPAPAELSMPAHVEQPAPAKTEVEAPQSEQPPSPK